MLLALQLNNLLAEEGTSTGGVELVASPQTNSGGWAFMNQYEAERQRRKARERRRKALEEELEEIAEAVDRDIATLLHEQEEIDDRKRELERLSAVVARSQELKAAQDNSERVRKAYIRAMEKGSQSSMEALYRELMRAQEEEEFLIMAVMLLN